MRCRGDPELGLSHHADDLRHHHEGERGREVGRPPPSRLASQDRGEALGGGEGLRAPGVDHPRLAPGYDNPSVGANDDPVGPAAGDDDSRSLAGDENSRLAAADDNARSPAANDHPFDASADHRFVGHRLHPPGCQRR